MSKKRPRRPSVNPAGRWRAKLTPAYWSKRLFKNSYTYKGQRCRVQGWSVKIQHAGQRRTLALTAGPRPEAAREALSIFQTILHHGWPRTPPNLDSNNAPSPQTAAYWRPRLIRRQYLDWLRERPRPEWSVCVERDARRHYFPLGTNSPWRAAQQAATIYGAIDEVGWDSACAQFEREFTLAIFWSLNPLAYTYTSLLSGQQATQISRSATNALAAPIWIIEPDPNIRVALAYWVSRQTPLNPLHLYDSTETAASAPRSKPDLVLINRLVRNRHLSGAEQLRAMNPVLPIYNYGVFEDSNQLFLSFSGIQAGYVLRRTRPEEFLAPYGFKPSAGRPASLPLPERIKRYFQSFFEQPSVNEDLPALTLLTEREKEILDALAKGYVDKEIADFLRISAWTVHSHLRNIFEKLNVRTRTEAVVRYLQK